MPLFRVMLPPGARTGLATGSQVMIDKIVSVPRTAIVREIGQCDPSQLEQIEEALRGWLNL